MAMIRLCSEFTFSYMQGCLRKKFKCQLGLLVTNSKLGSKIPHCFRIINSPAHWLSVIIISWLQQPKICHPKSTFLVITVLKQLQFHAHCNRTICFVFTFAYFYILVQYSSNVSRQVFHCPNFLASALEILL